MICKHDRLARACEICELEQRNVELQEENERLNDLLNKSDALWKNGIYVNGVLEKQNLEYRDKFHRAVKDYADQLTINAELAEVLREIASEGASDTTALWCIRKAREVLSKHGLSE